MDDCSRRQNYNSKWRTENSDQRSSDVRTVKWPSATMDSWKGTSEYTQVNILSHLTTEVAALVITIQKVRITWHSRINSLKLVTLMSGCSHVLLLLLLGQAVWDAQCRAELWAVDSDGTFGLFQATVAACSVETRRSERETKHTHPSHESVSLARSSNCTPQYAVSTLRKVRQ